VDEPQRSQFPNLPFTADSLSEWKSRLAKQIASFLPLGVGLTSNPPSQSLAAGQQRGETLVMLLASFQTGYNIRLHGPNSTTRAVRVVWDLASGTGWPAG
jgi:hypothetical protein